MDNTEAPVVMFTNYKRTDGFEVSLTLRGTNVGNVATELDKSIKTIKANGGTPVSRQSQKYPPKPVEYVENRVCPNDGAKLVYATKKDGTRYIKCENNKWINGQATGCQFVEWNNKPGISSEEISKRLGKQDFGMHDGNYSEEKWKND